MRQLAGRIAVITGAGNGIGRSLSVALAQRGGLALVGINFWGVVYGCKFFIPYLKREEEGHIVNLSSIFGIIGPPQGSSEPSNATICTS
jgi:NAD(P)-dependent dehydrogenase (short-subunit alcohol dehydrogenase family)